MPDPANPDYRDRAVRAVADRYVMALAELDPMVATSLGLRPGEDRLPDLSPVGQEALDNLASASLTELARVEGSMEPAGDERRCARLLRERLEAGLAMSAQGKHLRAVSNIFGPPHRVRGTFLDMPAATADDWAAIARRMARVASAFAQYRASLEEGASRGLLAGPRVVRTAAAQMRVWTEAADGRGWFADFAAGANVPPSLRADLDRAAASANEATTELARWLGDAYLARAQDAPDG